MLKMTQPKSITVVLLILSVASSICSGAPWYFRQDLMYEIIPAFRIQGVPVERPEVPKTNLVTPNGDSGLDQNQTNVDSQVISPETGETTDETNGVEEEKGDQETTNGQDGLIVQPNDEGDDDDDEENDDDDDWTPISGVDDDDWSEDFQIYTEEKIFNEISYHDTSLGSF